MVLLNGFLTPTLVTLLATRLAPPGFSRDAHVGKLKKNG